MFTLAGLITIVLAVFCLLIILWLAKFVMRKAEFPPADYHPLVLGFIVLLWLAALMRQFGYV